MINSEKAIIGCILIDNASIKKIYGFIKPDMFDDGLSKEAFEVILRMYDLGEKITVIELMQKLEHELRPQSEVKDFLIECHNSVDSSDSISKYGNVLIAEWRSKMLKEMTEGLTFLPRNAKNEIAMITTLCDSLKINDKPPYKSVSQIAREKQGYYFKNHETGLKTGLYELDEILIGLEKKDVTILGARPSVGKSILGLQIALNVASNSKRVGMFNLEMSNNQIFERILANKSGLQLNRIRKASSFRGNEEEIYKKAITKMQEMDNLLIFSGSYSVNEIKANCRNQGFELVIIDYLQLVKADKNYGNRVAEVGDISKGIKALAMEMDVPVIALSQLNRNKTAFDEPEIADLRESGDIEQDASNILFMWNMESDGRTKGLKVAKNRQGTLDKIALEFSGDTMGFQTIQKKFQIVEQDVARSEQTAKDLKRHEEESKVFSNINFNVEGSPFEDM